VASDKQIVAFKIGARARKMANEDCLIEGYEILWTAIAEAKAGGDTEIQSLLERELAKFEQKFVNGEADER
jgi:hypothetical protein